MTKLGTFDGQEVLRTTIAVTNAGDGLSEALKVEPALLHLGDKVYVVLECEVSKIRFDPIKDTDAVSRVHTLRAGNASIVDEALVKPMVDEMAARIQAAKEAEQGIVPMFDDERLMEAHAKGEHADRLVPGCGACDEEQRRADAEADDEEQQA